MSSYIEKNFGKLLKKNLIAIILAMQSKMSANNAEVLEEIRKVSSKFDIMQSDLVVTKKVISELPSGLLNMKHKAWVSAKYLRGESLEVACIPKEVEQKDLEGKMQSVLEKIGYKVDPDNIEDYHRLSKKSDNIIITFSRRKDCQHLFRVKKYLQSLNLDLDFRGEKKLCKSEFMSTLSDVIVQK